MTLHKFVYQYEGNVFLGERFPQQEIVIQSKCDDLDSHEILSLFKSYMLATGYAEKSFYDACKDYCEEYERYEKANSRRNGSKLESISTTDWSKGYENPDETEDQFESDIEIEKEVNVGSNIRLLDTGKVYIN